MYTCCKYLQQPIGEIMLELLGKYLYKASPMLIPVWDQYLDDLTILRNELHRRYMLNYGADSRCLRILSMMAGETDINYLVKQKNDYDRYINYFFPSQQIWNDVFRPTKNGRAYKKVFYKKGIYAPNEYLCPCDDVDHLKILPMNKPWEYWKHVKPVHIWYHDSNEYTLNMLENKIAFKHSIPTYSVVFIDSISLAFKYYKYITSDIPEEGEKSLHNFVHRHVLSLLFQDLQDVWITNQVLNSIEMVKDPENEELMENIVNEKVDIRYGFRGTRFKEAIDRLTSRIYLIKQGNNRPQNFLSSKIYPSGSIIDKINYSLIYLDMPHLRQYEYVSFLRDWKYFTILYELNKLNLSNPMYRNLCQELRIYVRRYKNSRFWNAIYDSSLRSKIDDYMNYLSEELL